MIESYHHAVGHQGRNYILSTLRRKFWIVGINKTLKKVLRSCLFCQKYHSKLQTQIMADLPAECVTGEHPAFFNTGIDCFGPFDVSQGRKTIKRYGCIFVCLATKAIHIEVLHTLSTDSFINGLRRFISRRGQVNTLFRTMVQTSEALILNLKRHLLNGIKTYQTGLNKRASIGSSIHPLPPTSAGYGNAKFVPFERLCLV